MGPLLDCLLSPASASTRVWRFSPAKPYRDALEALTVALKSPLTAIGVRLSGPEDGLYELRTRSSRASMNALLAILVPFSNASDTAPRELRLGDLGELEERPQPAWRQRHTAKREIESVLRSLDMLFNTDPLESTRELAPYPEVRQSVLNYGVGLGVGKAVSSLPHAQLESCVKRAIQSFESRLDPVGLNVRVVTRDHGSDPGQLEVMIEAKVRGAAAGAVFRAVTSIDLATTRARSISL